MGSPLGAAATIASDGRPSEGGEPDPANGYTIIQATDLHDAVVMAKGCPGLSSRGSVRVYEAAPVGRLAKAHVEPTTAGSRPAT